MFPDGVGGFLIEGFFELFEVVLSYVINTLSFLRVGGFVLSRRNDARCCDIMQMTSGGRINLRHDCRQPLCYGALKA